MHILHTMYKMSMFVKFIKYLCYNVTGVFRSYLEQFTVVERERKRDRDTERNNSIKMYNVHHLTDCDLGKYIHDK